MEKAEKAVQERAEQTRQLRLEELIRQRIGLEKQIENIVNKIQEVEDADWKDFANDRTNCKVSDGGSCTFTGTAFI